MFTLVSWSVACLNRALMSALVTPFNPPPAPPAKPRPTRRPKTAPAASAAYSSRLVPPTLLPDHAFRSSPPSASQSSFRPTPPDPSLKPQCHRPSSPFSHNSGRIVLSPRAATLDRNNYFQLDFSFLEEEPTFLRLSSDRRSHQVRPESFRRVSGASTSSVTSSQTWKNDYADMLKQGRG